MSAVINLINQMGNWFRLFLILFFLLLALFFKVQFEVQPHLPRYSSRKLISSSYERPNQVVLLLVDALRNDYASRFPFVSKLMGSQSNSTFLAKSKVGNPTMTTQRIESLMTGSEIFASGNILQTFLASKVDADNIIDQLNRANKSSVIFGDNTWIKLFNFTKSAVCINTFDVHDLNTCDQVVYDNLPQEINGRGNSTQKSDFIIAHLLGIDHVGHSTSSLDDSMMEVKIKQISNFLENIFTTANDNTLFIVTGDHGMRQDGNHGGSSKEEIETFVFGYLKGRQFYQQTKTKEIQQSDLTTTLSILLDIPLPNNAIGYPTLNLLPKQLVVPQKIAAMNHQLFNHFSQILQFYGSSLSVEESSNFESKLQLTTPFGEQQIIIQYLAQKLTFLKYSSPDPTRVIMITSLLSLMVVLILLNTFSNEFYKIYLTMQLRPVILLLCQGFPMFTLFIAYFSWTMIQSLSNTLIAGFVIAIVFGVTFNKQKQQKKKHLTFALIVFFVLAQIQPNKSNDYKPSIFRLQILNDIVSSIYFTGILSTLQVVFFIKNIILDLSNQRKKKIENKTSVTLTYIKIAILSLSYISYLSNHVIQQPLYFVTILQTVIIIVYAIILIIARQYHNNIADARFLVICFLSTFMGLHFPLILIGCLLIEQSASKCHSFAIIMSLLSKCIWWWLGNRYEYSGVDILKTYVYSDSYAIFLNGLSLVVYLNSPFILNLVLLNCRLLQDKEKYQTELSQIHLWHRPIVDEEEEHFQIKLPEIKDKKNQFINFLTKNNYKFTGVLLLGLDTGLWTSIINNQKLLFTVLCVPILVLTTLITLTTLVLVFILNYFYEKKLKTTQNEALIIDI